VWDAPTTTDRDRKELLRSLLEEVNIRIEPEGPQAHLTLRWRGGALTDLVVSLRRCRIAPNRTEEGTIELLRRLAVHYEDATIAGILNRQGRRTVHGERFTANGVGSLRRYRKIPRPQPTQDPPDGELVTVADAAAVLGVAPSTIHRWLADGFIVGEQITPGAPWRIRMTDELRGRFVEEAPDGYIPMLEATHLLGVSRQTVLQRVKRDELKAVHVRCGRRKGLRIKVIDNQPCLFEVPS
jgi:predicted DNA-binding transcriptional regulator AlpA